MSRRSTPADFWARVHQPEGPDACWSWTGPVNADGYGRLWYQGRQWPAHRLSALLSGMDPQGWLVCHRCDNPRCVRPSHLFLGTDADNSRDRDAKGRQVAISGDAHWRRRRPADVPRGESVGTSKLTAEAVRSIRARYRDGLGRSLAREYGVSQAAIHYVVVGKTWVGV